MTKEERLHKQQVEREIAEYRYKLAKRERIETLNLSPNQVLAEEIEKGRFPDLKSKRNSLKGVYLTQIKDQIEEKREIKRKNFAQKMKTAVFLKNLTNAEVEDMY